MKEANAAGDGSEPREARIDIYRGFSRVVPLPPAHLLKKVLEYEKRFFDEDNDLVYRERRERIVRWALDNQNRLVFPTAMVPRVARRLETAGYAVQRIDHREFGERFEVDLEMIANVEEYDLDEMLEAVRREPLGQIETTGSDATLKRAVAICRMYPQARVLFPAATRNSVRELRHKLQEELCRNIPILGQRRLAYPPRYAVCTLARLYTLDPANHDILLFTDPLRALGDVAKRGIGRFGMNGGRSYSFVAKNTKLSGREQQAMAAMWGEVIHRQSPDLLGVQVVCLPTPSCPKFDDCTGLDFKRKAYWHNRSRNDYIAAVAKAFAAYEWKKLQKYGVTTPYTPLVFADRRRNPLVAVVVESTEHGAELQGRLKGWGMLDAVPRKKNGLIHNNCESEKKPPGYIITIVVAKTYGIRADVLINATGGQGKPEVHRYPNTRCDKDDPDALLVDFTDEFNEQTAVHANQRRKQYSEAGWEDYVPHCLNESTW